MTRELWCNRCRIYAPIEEWRRVTQDGGAGIISRRGIEAPARLYRHDCNWFAVLVVMPKVTTPT